MPYLGQPPFLLPLLTCVTPCNSGVNALSRATSISTVLMARGAKTFSVNALSRATSISTIWTRYVIPWTRRVSMPYLGQPPFLRYPSGDRRNKGFQRCHSAVIHRIFWKLAFLDGFKVSSSKSISFVTILLHFKAIFKKNIHYVLANVLTCNTIHGILKRAFTLLSFLHNYVLHCCPK